MFRKKWFIALVVILLLAAVAGANFYFKKSDAVAINAEGVKKRDLEAIVTASGTIQAKRFVNISAVQMGRVTRLAVEEGDRVKAGQFLLEIDPNALRGTVERGEAAVAAAQAGLAQARANVETAKANLRSRATQVKRQRDLVGAAADDEGEPRSRGERREGPRDGTAAARETDVNSREQMIKQEAASLDTSRYNLRQVTLIAPFDGIVTRRNIEEGENVVVGTMNNAGTQLLTVADMSIIQAEVEVDETDIPSVHFGQTAKITIDALPDKHLHRQGHRDRQQPDPADHGHVGGPAGDELQGEGCDRRADPGGPSRVHLLGEDHHRHARAGAVGADSGDGRPRGHLRPVRRDRPRAEGPEGEAAAQGERCGVAAQAELKPGQTRKEVEGVFMMRQRRRKRSSSP